MNSNAEQLCSLWSFSYLLLWIWTVKDFRNVQLVASCQYFSIYYSVLYENLEEMLIKLRSLVYWETCHSWDQSFSSWNSMIFFLYVIPILEKIIMTENPPVLSLHSHNSSSGPCFLCIFNNADNLSTKQCDHEVEDFIKNINARRTN